MQVPQSEYLFLDLTPVPRVPLPYRRLDTKSLQTRGPHAPGISEMLGALLLTLRLASLSVLLLFASSVLPVQYPLHHPPALPEQFKLTVAAELAEVLTDRGSGPFINMDFW